ncbi:hypothetical protein [Azospirillum doebereinerae]
MEITDRLAAQELPVERLIMERCVIARPEWRRWTPPGG